MKPAPGVQVFILIRFSCHTHSHHTPNTFPLLFCHLHSFNVRCVHSFHSKPNSLVIFQLSLLCNHPTYFYHLISSFLIGFFIELDLSILVGPIHFNYCLLLDLNILIYSTRKPGWLWTDLHYFHKYLHNDELNLRFHMGISNNHIRATYIIYTQLLLIVTFWNIYC